MNPTQPNASSTTSPLIKGASVQAASVLDPQQVGVDQHTRPADRTDFAKFKSCTFFGSLDGLRAISVLGVVWHHTAEPIAAIPMSGRGFVGVDMFFVLSGFLIVTLLLREKQRYGDVSLKKFYMRRSLRIFPLYYGLILALIALFGFVASGSSMAEPFFSRLPYYLTYTSNWVPAAGGLLAIAWSLAAEEQFYLVWPPLEKWVGNRWALFAILIVLIGINQLVNFQIVNGPLSRIGLDYAELEMLQVTFTPILLGVGLAHLMHHPAGYRFISKTFGQRWMPFLWLGLLVLVLNIPNNAIGGLHRLCMHILMTLLLASTVAREDHQLRPILSIPLLARIGVISYGIYLLHMLVRMVGDEAIRRFDLGGIPGLLFIVTLVGTIVAAEISFRFFETPFLKLKSRWRTH